MLRFGLGLAIGLAALAGAASAQTAPTVSRRQRCQAGEGQALARPKTVTR